MTVRNGLIVTVASTCGQVTKVSAELQEKMHTAEGFAGLALMSAILKGGLLRREACPAFCQEIARGAQLFRAKMTGDLVWMELQLPRRLGRAAQEPRQETLRFYPDCVTLSLMARARGAKLPLSLSAKSALQFGLTALEVPYSERLLEDIEQAAFVV